MSSSSPFSSPQSPQSPSSSPPPFEQLSAESRSLFSDHYHLGRLFLGLRSAAWSALHLDAQGSVDFYRERNRENQWRLAVASVSSGAKAQVDALGPAGLTLELGGQVGATSMSRLHPDVDPVISWAVRLTTSGGWYRLEGRYEGANDRFSLSAVLAKRDFFKVGDRLLVGATSVEEGVNDLSGRRVGRRQWTAKWTSPPSPTRRCCGRSSTTSRIVTLRETFDGINFYGKRELQWTIGTYYQEELPRSPITFKYRLSVSRKWPWSDGVTKWTSLEKEYKEFFSSGWEVKFGKGGWPIVSCGASLLIKERGLGGQLKVKVNSRGELAAAIVHYRTDLTSAFAPTTIVSLSGMVDVWRRRASIGFGLEFTE